MIPVEDICNGNRPYRNCRVGGQCHQKGSGQRVPPDGTDRIAPGRTFPIPGGSIFAYDRLDALSDPGEDRYKDKRDVGKDAVCCHAGVSVEREDQKVKYNDHNAGGQL